MIANHAKSFYKGPNPRKAKYVYKLARLELGRFARIITGHNNLGFFQTKIGLSGSPMCRFCGGGQETITHLLRECPCFELARRDLFKDRLPTPDMEWSVRGLLDFSYLPRLNEACEGTWTDSDYSPGLIDGLDTSFGTGWLDVEGDEADGDENNNNIG